MGEEKAPEDGDGGARAHTRQLLTSAEEKQLLTTGGAEGRRSRVHCQQPFSASCVAAHYVRRSRWRGAPHVRASPERAPSSQPRAPPWENGTSKQSSSPERGATRPCVPRTSHLASLCRPFRAWILGGSYGSQGVALG